jgi:hypothetical protein
MLMVFFRKSLIFYFFEQLLPASIKKATKATRLFHYKGMLIGFSRKISASNTIQRGIATSKSGKYE